MRMRYLSPLLVSLFGLILSAHAQEATSFAKARGKLITRTYPVADLIVPLNTSTAAPVIQLPAPPPPGASYPRDSACTEKAQAACSPLSARYPTSATCAPAKCCEEKTTCEDRLIRLIQKTIGSYCWSEQGGPGTIDYYPLGMALIVNAEAAVQEQVAELLSSLRRLQDTTVTLDVRIVSAADGFLERIGLNLRSDLCERIGIDFNAGTNGQPPAVEGPGLIPVSFLNDKQVVQFLEAIQGDQRTTVCAAPKLTMLNGATATIQTEVARWVPQKEVLSKCGDFTLPCVRVETTTTPFTLRVCPIVSADRRCVRLHLQAAIGKTDLCKTVSIPVGGTMIVGGWKRPRDLVPMPIQVPLLSRLFQSPVGEMETIVMLVTPRVEVCKEAQTPLMPPRSVRMLPPMKADPHVKPAAFMVPMVEPVPMAAERPSMSFRAMQVAKLMEMYHEACAGGHHDEARKLAAFALELDPTCFSKSKR